MILKGGKIKTFIHGFQDLRFFLLPSDLKGKYKDRIDPVFFGGFPVTHPLSPPADSCFPAPGAHERLSASVG